MRSKNQRPGLCYRTALHEPLIKKKRLKSPLTAPLCCSRSFCELAEPEAEIWAQICDAHQWSGPLSLVEPAYAKDSGCVGHASTVWRCGAHNRQRLLQKCCFFFKSTLWYQYASGSIMWSDSGRCTIWTKVHCSICRCTLTMVLQKWHILHVHCHPYCSTPLDIIKVFQK